MSFKINKVNEIPEKCLDNDTHLYIKEDGTLYVNKKDGSIINIGGKGEVETHTHTNLDNLNKIGEDSEGNLTYNGNIVNKAMVVASENTVGGIKIARPFRITDDNTLALYRHKSLTLDTAGNINSLKVNCFSTFSIPISNSNACIC